MKMLATSLKQRCHILTSAGHLVRGALKRVRNSGTPDGATVYRGYMLVEGQERIGGGQVIAVAPSSCSSHCCYHIQI